MQIPVMAATLRGDLKSLHEKSYQTRVDIGDMFSLSQVAQKRLLTGPFGAKSSLHEHVARVTRSFYLEMKQCQMMMKI